jgi:hypothetical protein
MGWLGWLASGVVALLAVGVGLNFRELRRYLKIRKM